MHLEVEHKQRAHDSIVTKTKGNPEHETRNVIYFTYPKWLVAARLLVAFSDELAVCNIGNEEQYL